MGHSQVPSFVVEALDGSVIQVTLVEWHDKAEVLSQYERDGRIAPGAPIVDHPNLPSTPSYRWRIKNGVVVDDPTVPDPATPKQALLDLVNGATTIAQLKTLLARYIEKGR